MNGDQNEKLNQIYDDVRETRAGVEVVEEQVSSIDAKLNRIEKRVEDNDRQIDNLESKVTRNTTIIGGFVTGVTGLVIWSADKIGRII